MTPLSINSSVPALSAPATPHSLQTMHWDSQPNGGYNPYFTAAGMSPDDRANVQAFVNAQRVAFEKAAGWIFWTWKTESAPEWSFVDLANAGIINVGALGEYLVLSADFKLRC